MRGLFLRVIWCRRQKRQSAIWCRRQKRQSAIWCRRQKRQSAIWCRRQKRQSAIWCRRQKRQSAIWCRRQKRQSALTLTCAAFSAKRAFSAFNSGRVMSGTSASAAWISSAWASVRRESRSPPSAGGCGPPRPAPRGSAGQGPGCAARAGRHPAASAGHPRRPGASPASGWHWRRSRRTGSRPDGTIDPRRWRPKPESEGRRTALWAYRSVFLVRRCPESDQPRFAYPGRLYQREHRSNSGPTNVKATPYRHFVSEYPNRTSYFQPVIEKLQYVSPDVVGDTRYVRVWLTMSQFGG